MQKVENIECGDIDEINFDDVIKFVIKHKTLIILVTVFSTLLGYISSLFVTKKYLAESGIILLNGHQIVSFEPRIQTKEINDSISERKKTIQEMIKSADIISLVLQRAKSSGLLKNNNYDIDYFLSNKKSLDVNLIGDFFSIKVITEDPSLSMFMANEIAKISTEKINNLLFEYITEQDLDARIRSTKEKYDKAIQQYNSFLSNNQITKLSFEIDRLKKLFDYYSKSIVDLEKDIWQARLVKEQIQNSSLSPTDITNSLVLLKFKSSIFTGDNDFSIKLDLQKQDLLNSNNLESTVKDINNIIEILEKRKAEFTEILSKEKYEQKIQDLEKKLNDERNKEKDLLQNQNLIWETLVSLRRKKEEVSLSSDIGQEIKMKILYFCENPILLNHSRKINILLGLIFGIFFSLFVAYVFEHVKKNYN